MLPLDLHLSIYFIKEDDLYKRGEQVGVDPYPDEEEIKYAVLDDDREHHWRMVFEGVNGGMDRTKSLLHAKKWDVYNS